jgi:hypothetical protein
MALDYAEKRNYFRMNMDCNVEYSVNGNKEKQCGQLKSLSGNGVSFMSAQAVQPGTEVQVSITPENSITPPLHVTVEVLRCQAEGNKFEIAGNITRR